MAAAASEPEFKLVYDAPATKWTGALLLGNGRVVAMVFGGTEDERLQINESSLWGGGPHDYTNPEAEPAHRHVSHLNSLYPGHAISLGATLTLAAAAKKSSALPRQWPSGSLKGVRVRGGAKLDLTWRQGQLTELRLQADHALRYRVSYGSLSAEARVEPGRPVVLDGGLRQVRP